ncbi:MAG TPA: lysophospholipid acyltransferase family protein [Microlunatus sp.]|nr:lysophospholipid acyltransferase family protein [Microlunatus sp.]
MTRELAPWATDDGRRRGAGRIGEAVGDLRTLATGWHWDLTVEVAKAAVGAAVGTVKGDEDAPPIPTGWARKPFVVAVRDVAQTGALRPLLRAEVSLERHGTDHLSGVRGPAMLVANHASHLDVGAVLATLPAAWRARTAVALSSDAFFHAWWKAGAAALAYNTFQLPESEPSENGAVRFDVGPLSSVLNSGWNVLVFPEGSRTRDGIIQPFHADVAALAAKLSVPVVPIGIRGAFTALPQGSRWPRPGRPRVAVRYGAALEAQPAESAEVYTARIHRAVADLIEEDLTTWWQVRRSADRIVDDVPASRWRRIWQQSEAPTVGGRPRRPRIWRS